jgi:hypothetical protein
MEIITPATQSVGATILKQLGWNKFIAMTGAKGFIFSNNGLSFRLSSTMTKNRINLIEITLTCMDLYLIRFFSVRKIKNYGNSVLLVEEIDGIYDDGLKAVIEDRTGLRLSL